MFDPVSIPYGAKMLVNTVTLKPGVTMDDAELAIGDMCGTVKQIYGGSGFIAGQVFRFSGFISAEGSLNAAAPSATHIAIVTYWRSFEEHEKSHADHLFKAKFSALADLCTESRELGYELLWQGEAGVTGAIESGG